MRLFLGCVAFGLLLTPAASRQLTAIRVSESDDLQKAIDAARPGDTLLLQPGARFTGNYLLPHHPDARTPITIRTAGSDLPPDGTRTGPGWSGRLAILQSPNSTAVLRLAKGAHHWRLENLEFRANRDGHGDIIQLGHSRQSDPADVPHTLVLDRLYIVGDPERGQKRAIALNSGATAIRNCYIAGIKGVGMDTQAIAAWNGPGPYVIENNYLEAAGENVLVGGGDPLIPNLVPSDIVVRGNLIAKPEEWRKPIVAAPGGVRAAPSAGAGALEAGHYIYRVVAERPAGQGTTAVSQPSEAIEIEAGPGASVALRWQPVPGAEAYRVYRASPDGASTTWRVEKPGFVDTGAGGEAGKPPRRATVWSVKNLFELKNARNVTVEGNVFERHWAESQPGYAILMQVKSQSGRAPWATIENVRIVNNVIRDVSSAIHIVGVDQRDPSGRMRGVTIANNLIVGVDHDRWGGAGDFLLIGGGGRDIRVEHNTVLQTGRIISVFGGSREPKYVEGFVFRNNIVRHNRYGVKGRSEGVGAPSIERYFPQSTFEGNLIGGGRRSLYPPGNHFVAGDDLEEEFAGPGNYRLRPGSRFGPAGADLDAIEKATRHAGGGVPGTASSN